MTDDEDDFLPPGRPQPWPWWVSLGLWGLPGRGWAWAFFWLALLLAAGSVAAGLYYWPAFAGLLMIFAALWYFAAIKWVDRYGDWP